MPTILLTGFEPFAGADCNPSARVVESLAGTPLPNARLVTATLPVVAGQVPTLLYSLIEQHRPDAVLCLGEARGSPHVRVERRAVNRLEFVTDNSGATAVDQPVVAGGPDEYESTFPADAIVAAITARGIACAPSLSAGTFCCNQILYHALHHAAARTPAMRAGFLHLPSLPEQCVGGRGVTCSMPLATQVIAVRVALEAIAAHLASGNDDAARPV